MFSPNVQEFMRKWQELQTEDYEKAAAHARSISEVLTRDELNEIAVYLQSDQQLQIVEI